MVIANFLKVIKLQTIKDSFLCFFYGVCLRAMYVVIAVSIVFFTCFEQVTFASEAFHQSSGKDSSMTNIGDSALRMKKTTGSKQNFMMPKPFQFATSPTTNLPVLFNGQMAIPSNADNFHGAMNASVDPRTGSASFSLPVATVLYDQGQGRRDLTLSYSGSPTPHGPDSLGLGPHWAFNIGTEHPSISEVAGHKTTNITTGDGHSFTMESDKNSQGDPYWHPLRHKLDDVKITGEPGNWTIAAATGVREHLEYGYEDWEEERDGQRVWFYYDRNGPSDITRKLLYICGHPLTEAQVHSQTNACAGNGIQITYQGNNVYVHGYMTIVLHMGQTDGDSTVESVSMPSLSDLGSTLTANSDNQPAQIQFSYDNQGNRPWLLKKVISPSGQATEFLYNDESDHNTFQPQGLPTGFNKAHIPVVTEEITTPNIQNKNAISQRRIWFRYSASMTDQHNYTGYQVGVSEEPGKDNLFDRADNYTYTVAEDNGLTTTTRVYNKYHLPLSIIQTDDLQKSVVAKNDITYSPWKGTTFFKLLPTYSLPLKTSKTLYSITRKGNDSTVLPAKVFQQSKYNNNGQVIWQQDAYGRQTFTQYCPIEGDKHCPQMNPAWPQVALPEKVLVIPARKSPAGSIPFTTFATTSDVAPAIEVEFNYKLIPVATRYKARIQKYRKILQKQWKQDKKTTLSKGYPNNLNDTSNASLSGSWQVSTKITGTISPETALRLKPGQALPELNQNQLSTTTNYQYDLQQNSLTYGELTQLTVIQFHKPVTLRKFIGLNNSTSEDDNTQQLTFNVTHNIDSKNHTRSTDVEIVAKHAPSDILNARQLLKTNQPVNFGDEGGLSLGKSVYSLTTGVKISSEDVLKTLNAEWTYDIWQRPIKEVITPSDNSCPQIITWTYIATDNEQSVVKTMPYGTQQKIIYIGDGKDQKVISTWHRNKDQSSLPLEGTSGWIEDSSMTYTTTDKIASKTVYRASDNDGKTIALTTTFGYDALNRRVWEKSPDGTVKVSVRNDPQMLSINYLVASKDNNQSEKLGPILSVVQSNVIGKPVAQYTFALNPQETVNGKRLYSDQLQTTLTTLEQQLSFITNLNTLQSYGLLPLLGKNGLFAFVNDAIHTGAWLTKTTTLYDGNGRQTGQIQPNNAQTHFQWQYGNLVATIAPNGSIIHDSFDIQGDKISRCVQPAGQTTCHILGTRGYDDEGNLAWQIDDYGNRINYTYDADGRMLSMTIPATTTEKEHTFTYSYNSFARTSESVDGVVYATYTYNPKTWQLTDQEDNISHLHYNYDPNTGELIKITRSVPVNFKPPAGINYPTGTETMTYDRFGQALSMKDLAGNVYTATHDIYGRVLQSKVTLFGQSKPTILSSTTYDPYFNRPVEIINGIGIIRDFVYNDLGNLERTIDKQNDTIIQQLSYTYNPQTQNITSFTRTQGKESATQSYKYDKNTNSLTEMSCNVTGKPGVISALCPRDTDLSGSNLTDPPIIASQQYIFDDWNNIKTVNEKLVISDGKSTIKTTRYSYAYHSKNNYDPHRMTEFRTQWQANVSDFSTAPDAITYDNLGRVIKDANGNTIHYNIFGQLNSFTNQHTGEQTSYIYDSTGHQVAESSVNAQGKMIQQPLYMVYQGDNIEEQVQKDSTGKIHTSVSLAGIAYSEDGKISNWYMHDYKGDVISIFNNSGQRTSDCVYSPYGMSDNLLSDHQQALPNKLQIASQKLWIKIHRLGFDDQMNDPATDYQFLGGGYRAYNSIYRHFMTHDSYSPFQHINGYGFGDNNPIMNTDPTGHLPKWVNYLMGAVGIAMSVVCATILPVAAAGTIAGITASVGAANAIISSASAGMGLIGVTSGSLQIASTVYPENKNLAIASESFGLANGLVNISMGQGSMGIGIANAYYGLGKLTSVLLFTSGLTGLISGTTSGAQSGIAFGTTVDQNLSHKAGLYKAEQILGVVSMGFSVASMVSGIIDSGITIEKMAFRKFSGNTTLAARIPGDIQETMASVETEEDNTEEQSLDDIENVKELLEHNFQQYSGPSIQSDSEETSLKLRIRDWNWSPAVSFEDDESPSYNIDEHIRYYEEDVMRQRYAQVKDEQKEEFPEHFGTIENFKNTAARGHLEGNAQHLERFLSDLKDFRAEIGYDGPILNSSGQFHPNFIAHMIHLYPTDSE